MLLKDAKLRPTYAKTGDAGADLRSPESVTIEPGKRQFIPTGVSIQLPENCVAFVVPRSGLAKKHGITITNSPGVIDAGYRGEIGVTLHNLGENPYPVQEGERIAQLVIVPFVQADFIEVDALEDSDRGTGGFGHTGKK
jgi:dUTP pyrophosphatase